MPYNRKFVVLFTALAAILTTQVAGAETTAYNPFPDCSPAAVPDSVSLVLKGPCTVVPGQTNKYVLVMTNSSKSKLLSARLVFARKSFIARSSVPFKDENPSNSESRVDWSYSNVPVSAQRKVVLWLKFKRLPGAQLTSYILWLQAKPKGLGLISRAWYPRIYFEVQG